MVISDDVFKAIAHPARREMLALLARAPLAVKELTSEFKMSQPAVSQHLKELRAARLVDSERVGLEQRYRLPASPLKAVYEWAAQYKLFFDPSGHAWAIAASAVDADPLIALQPALQKKSKKHGKKKKKEGRRDGR
jgi:DNA-binding transcriptional ArsR family regulator